jgi:type I restriction enzyme M protein
MKFDYIVSNPPFKLDFSDFRNDLDTKANNERFFAGIPKIKLREKDKMEIYLLFIQHILYSLSDKGRAAIVVPTGFLTASNGIEKKIKERLIDKKILKGAISMPPNIFANTGTNVSILFICKDNKDDQIVLMDASKLGEKIKIDDKNQKTILKPEEEKKIISVFNDKQLVEDFSVVVSCDQVKEKNYSLSAGQHFEVKIKYVDITPEQFSQKIIDYKKNLNTLFAESKDLEVEIQKQLKNLKYE